MAREKGAWSTDVYKSRATEVKARGGTSTYEGEERVRQGKGLDPLVDPKGLEKYGPVRGSGNLLIQLLNLDRCPIKCVVDS